jgi:Zn finger protein HypA/HybF involved in hydrogenase expression
MTFPDDLSFTIQFPTREGFLSRQCAAVDCKRVFKVHKDDIRDEMHCPYCGTAFPNDQLWTDEQERFIRESALHRVQPLLEHEINEMFRRAFSGPGWTFSPGTPEPRKVPPTAPDELATDSELKCPQCNVRFQVEGIFGFCPACRSENLRLYDANLAIIRREIAENANPARALRHAYSDLVSTFEIFCRKEAAARGLGTGRFQNIAAARKFFVDALSIDIWSPLSPDVSLSVRRAFQKRHVLEHNAGTIDQRYISEVPEDASLVGGDVWLDTSELELAATGVRRMLEAIVASR